MKNRLTWGKIIILGVLLVTPFALAQCGDSEGESVASAHVGPVGPTYPGGYYFDATVTPHSAPGGSTIYIVVRTWDKDGLPAPGVMITFGLSGPDTTVGDPFPTDSNGYAHIPYKIEGTGGVGGVTHVSIIIEGTVLMLPVQIIATSS